MSPCVISADSLGPLCRNRTYLAVDPNAWLTSSARFWISCWMEVLESAEDAPEVVEGCTWPWSL